MIREKYVALARDGKRKSIARLYLCDVVVCRYAPAIAIQDGLALTTTLPQLKFTTVSVIAPCLIIIIIDGSFYLSTVIENLAYTHRVDETTVPFRCAPSVPGRATDTSPRAHQGLAHRRSRCGRQRRQKMQTRSYLVPHECRLGRRCRSWPRTYLSPPQSLGSC